MSTTTDQFASYGYALALAAHAGFAIYLAAKPTPAGSAPKPERLFLGALGATALWAAASFASQSFSSFWIQALTVALDLSRYGLWFLFLLTILGPDAQEKEPGPSKGLGRVALACLAGATGLEALGALGIQVSGLATAALTTHLALPLCGLVMVEQVFRSLRDDSRWSAKPACLGLACVFVFDIYLYAEGLMFGTFDRDALNVRGLVHTLAVPFLFVATRRGGNWMARLQVSRTAAFYSATLVLGGGYLLLMAAVGYSVRFFGGEWGRALQISLLVASVAFLGTLVFSGALRSWLRVFVGKHFYRYRYDYREEWLRFTSMLSAQRSPQEMGELIVRGLAKMVECPAGGLWTRSGAEEPFKHAAAWNMTSVADSEPFDSSLCKFLQGEGWVIDLDEYRSAPRRYEGLALPNWLLAVRNGWLVVPLLSGNELLGFVVLMRPVTDIKLNWEVLDLLKTAGRQAAGYLAQMQATEALLDARKFEAFNRMSAFVVHDLKNIVAQLSLMLKNAERLHDNREFQQDMLLTVESSLEKMRRLMLQLREGATPPGGSRGVEISSVLNRLTLLAKAHGRTLEVEEVERLSTRGHDDRLERVLGHLVQNAFDATPTNGRVWIKAQRFSGQVQVEIGDTGAGMAEDFVRTRLFRPFNTTKHNGMGIGTYESSQYIRELGGSISVASEPGRGTLITVLLPLFEAQRGSDLMEVGSR